MESPLGSRPSSPVQLSAELIQWLKEVQDKLASGRDDLGKLDIPKLKEVLAKFIKLLEFSKKTRGNDDAVRNLVVLGDCLHQTTLAPIMAAKQNISFSISKELTSSLHNLFNALDSAIPERSQLSRVTNLFTSRTDMGRTVSDATLKIASAMNTFLTLGSIERTDGFHLTQDRDKLPSQAQLTLKICPRFRILLLGRSGTGKSSLINRVFGETRAEVSHYRAGDAEILEEHSSLHNPYFVLHDSMGFESGSDKQYAIVEAFIRERSRKPQLTERLHAIWLCASIPVAGGRVLETGDENIFRLDLGNVPLIIVFTKYDNLITNAELDHPEFDDAQIRTKAEENFEELCARPLAEICTGDLNRTTPPFIKVSVEKGYHETLSNLITLTRSLLPDDTKDRLPDNLGFQVAPTPSDPDSNGVVQNNPMSAVGITLAVAQRADPGAKIDAIIAIGRQKYWQGLAGSLDFKEKTLAKCVAVVHDDIVQVWNFLDPGKHLMSEKFKSLMSYVVEELVDQTPSRSPTRFFAGLTSAAGLTHSLGPSTLVIGSLALTFVFAKWIYDVYQQTPAVLRCLMAYIVDLTIVVRRLFWLMQETGGIYPVSEELLEQAVDEYNSSQVKVDVHQSITRFTKDIGPLKTIWKDTVVDEIEQLIRTNPFDLNMSQF